MSRPVLLWAVRLLLLCGIAYFLAQRIERRDTLELVDGRTLRGTVESLEDGRWRVELDEGGPALVVEASEVRVREGGQVPAVSWGLATLAGRLGRHGGLVLAVLGLLTALLVVTAFRWFLLMRAADLPIPLHRALRLGFIGAFFNLAVPGSTGGDVVKAWYAARATGLATRSVISVFMDRVLGLFGLALLAGGALLVSPGAAGEGPARWLVLAVVAGGLLGATLLLVERVRRALGLTLLARRLPFRTLWAEAGQASRLYRGHPGALLVAVAISVANHAVSAFVIWLLARGLDIGGVGLGQALVLVPIANLAGAVPLVPGGWGVGELAFAWLFGQIGVPPTAAIGLSVVNRLGLLAVSLPGAPLWIFWRGRPSRASIAREYAAATHEVEAREASARRAEVKAEEIGGTGSEEEA